MTTLKEVKFLAKIIYENADKFNRETEKKTFLKKITFLIHKLGGDFIVARCDNQIPKQYNKLFFGCGSWPKANPEYPNNKIWGLELQRIRERVWVYGVDER